MYAPKALYNFQKFLPYLLFMLLVLYSNDHEQHRIVKLLSCFIRVFTMYELIYVFHSTCTYILKVILDCIELSNFAQCNQYVLNTM